VAAHNDLLNIPTPIDGGLYYNKHFLPAASHCTQRDLVKSPDGRKRYPQQYFGRYLGLMPKYTDDFPKVTSSSVKYIITLLLSDIEQDALLAYNLERKRCTYSETLPVLVSISATPVESPFPLTRARIQARGA
jgi:hypothetical protein